MAVLFEGPPFLFSGYESILPRYAGGYLSTYQYQLSTRQIVYIEQYFFTLRLYTEKTGHLTPGLSIRQRDKFDFDEVQHEPPFMGKPD